MIDYQELEQRILKHLELEQEPKSNIDGIMQTVQKVMVNVAVTAIAQYDKMRTEQEIK